MKIVASSVRNRGPEDLFIAPSLLMKYANSVSDEDPVGGMLWRNFISFIDAGWYGTTCA
jgi:hypothetical protein